MSRRSTTLLVTSLAFAMVAQAQSSDTTGAFRGRVTTTKGTAVSGGIVSIRSVDTGLARTAQTGADGTFTIGLLPVGDYKVTVRAAGQKTVEDKVRVSLGDAASRAYKLEEETAGATVEIVESTQTLDPAQVNVVATIDEKLVTKIPLVKRNFLDLVRLTPGAVAGPGDPPRLMVQGARQIMNNLQIDGATNNSNFFGEQRGGAIIPFVFGADTIKELQVITNGYDAQYGNAAGAVINAITKSGTNEFQGSALYLVRNDNWMAKAAPTPYASSIGQNSEKNLTRVGDSYNMNVNVGGPIIKDKLFYFVGAETYATNRLATPSFSAPTGSPTSGNTPTDYAAFQGSSLFNVLTSRNGHTFGQEGTTQFPYMQETKNTSYFARLDYNLMEGHRLSLRVNYNKFKDTIGGGNTPNTPESNELLNTTNAISWVLEHSAIWTNELFSETRLQVSNERRPFDGNGVSPAISLFGFTAGTKTSTPRQMNEIMTELINNTTWTHGDWTLKAGIDLQKISIENQFFNNGNGAISFGSYKAAADWAAGGAALAANEPGGIRYNGATSINGGRVDIDTKLNAEYLQAQYQAFDHRLTLTGGLRFTQQKISNNPRPNANLAGLDSPVDSSNRDPRLAFAWDVDGTAKTVIRGGYGYFSTPTPMLLVANTMTGNGNTIVNYAYTLNGSTLGAFQNGFLSSAQLINGQTFNKVSDDMLIANATSGAGAVQVWDPRTKMARAHKASLGIDHDLGNGLTVSATVTDTEFSHLQYLVNINLGQKDAAGNLTGAIYNDGYPTTINSFSNAAGARPGEAIVDGRLLRFGLGQTASNPGGLPGNPAGGFGDVYLVKGDARGRYRGLALEVKKVWNSESGILGNITFSKSQDQNSNERGTFTSVGNFPNSELALAATTNPADPKSDWGYSWADRFAVANIMAYFPIYWGIQGSARFNYSTGLPYSALRASGNDSNGDGIPFNDIAFGGRNGQRQPDTKIMDLRLTRAWTVYKKYQIETSIDVFNVFNWSNQFVNDNEQVATTNSGAISPTFGQIGGRDFNTREVQLGLRLRF
ncbi:MAG TPA: carboxypeptidase regulatory-like domain-containing protein [Holophagaceae bacterium]|nr:carboxypeptidase regulatory-like domain-containing protein [Holophagaceae bacterium]